MCWRADDCSNVEAGRVPYKTSICRFRFEFTFEMSVWAAEAQIEFGFVRRSTAVPRMRHQFDVCDEPAVSPPQSG